MNNIDYNKILKEYKYTNEQAANDLERLLLRGELPSVGSVAKAIVVLRNTKENNDVEV